MRSATVVLPVPGLPVNDICSVGGPETSPTCSRARATRRKAAISRMRCLTGARPTRSRSSSAIGAAMSVSACKRLEIDHLTGGATAQHGRLRRCSSHVLLYRRRSAGRPAGRAP